MYHLIKTDAPIKETLNNVVSGLTTKVLERFYGGDESKIPAIDYLGVKPAPVPSLPGGMRLFVVQGTSYIANLFIVFLSPTLARRLSSACSVISPTSSPFMVLHAPLDV